MATTAANNFSAFALSALLLLTACGGGGDTSSTTQVTAAATVQTRVVSQSDLEIAQALYIDSNRVPSDFYSEGAPPSTGYISTTHLKSTDLVTTSTPQHELCSDDWNQAFTWSEQVAHNAAQYADLVGSDSNSRFFEFSRVRSAQPDALLRARVFKCNYVDRDAVDLRATSAIAGQLNRHPATAADLKELAEYLWQFTLYNNYGNAVLKSSGTTTSTGLQHTLVIASLTQGAGGSGCDRIDVRNWIHSLDIQSGELTLTTTALWNFNSKHAGGLTELCAN